MLPVTLLCLTACVLQKASIQAKHVLHLARQLSVILCQQYGPRRCQSAG